MMSVSHSPATPKHPAHISTLLPNAEQKGNIQYLTPSYDTMPWLDLFNISIY